VEGTRPPDELARRLLDHGGIDAVHMYVNMVTVDLSKGATGDGLVDVIRELFLFYREPSAPGQEPRVDEPAPDAAAEPAPEATATT
jgi:hypothetical protein